MVTNPVERAMGTRTASKPPMAQDSWKPLSKRANARPLASGGTSRCTIESKANLPEPAARPMPAAMSTATAQCRPQLIRPALTPTTPTTTEDDVNIHSSAA
jgi:hypothetical protein